MTEPTYTLTQAVVWRIAVALSIADNFCSSLTADESPDTVHNPITAALKEVQSLTPNTGEPVVLEKRSPVGGGNHGWAGEYNRGWNDCIDATKPAPASGEREALIERLRGWKIPGYIPVGKHCILEAADMLAADAQLEAERDGERKSRCEAWAKSEEAWRLVQSLQAQQVAVPQPPFGTKRKAAMAIYTPPFTFEHGYVFDSKRNMVADQGGFGDKNTVEGAVALQIRGWGRIGYMPNPEALQDEIGAMVVDALNTYYAAPQPPQADARIIQNYPETDKEPMTRNEIHLALDAAGIKPMGASLDQEERIVRAAEAHHGISK